jgi:CRISPR/Cas system-associated exonuclease Cas4 (RecB family)
MGKLKDVFIKQLAKERPSDPNYVPKFKIKPSVVGSPCMRKVYYTSAGVKPDYDFPIDGKLRMVLGDSIHHMLSSVFRESGVLIDYHNPDGTYPRQYKGKNLDGTVILGEENREFPISFPELYITSGKIDGIVVIDSKLWIAEFKSINQKGFTGLMAPKPDHLIQACCYYYIFNEHLKAGKYSHIKALDGFTQAEGVLYLYVNKDDTQMKEFQVTAQDEFFAQIVQKIINIKAAYDSKTLPPKTQDYCYSCAWRDKCKSNKLE